MFRLHVVFSDLQIITLETFLPLTSQMAKLLAHTVDQKIVVDVCSVVLSSEQNMLSLTSIPHPSQGKEKKHAHTHAHAYLQAGFLNGGKKKT